jgi:serine-type D-Ala-D-Ala carboxypeptidase
MNTLDDKVSNIMASAIREHTFPGGVVGYIREGVTQVLPFGHLTYEADAPAVASDTVYDLASVTKSIPTASIILALIEQGVLSLDDQVIKYIPEFAVDGRETVLIRHLLCFTAVFDLPKPLSSYAKEGRKAILERVFATPLRYPPGERYLYADIPYLLLGMVAERALSKPLDVIADGMFFSPLGMHATTFHPETLTQQVAPTEITQGGEVRRRAQDEKAWALYKEGQIAGHAGLFSTASDLLRFCQMLLNKGESAGRRYFKPETIALMQTKVAGDDTLGPSYGWMTRTAFIGPELTPGTFGKGGFTGTAVTVDIEKQRSLVILTNRTYPKRPDTPTPMHQLRRQLADLLLV